MGLSLKERVSKAIEIFNNIEDETAIVNFLNDASISDIDKILVFKTIYPSDQPILSKIKETNSQAYDQIEKMIEQNKSFFQSRENLIGRSFEQLDLQGFDLKATNLKNLDFSFSSFENMDLSKADLSQANFTGANFSAANLDNTKIFASILNYADLTNASIREAYMEASTLAGTKLTSADLSNTFLNTVAFVDEVRKLNSPDDKDYEQPAFALASAKKGTWENNFAEEESYLFNLKLKEKALEAQAAMSKNPDMKFAGESENIDVLNQSTVQESILKNLDAKDIQNLGIAGARDKETNKAFSLKERIEKERKEQKNIER